MSADTTSDGDLNPDLDPDSDPPWITVSTTLRERTIDHTSRGEGCEGMVYDVLTEPLINWSRVLSPSEEKEGASA